VLLGLGLDVVAPFAVELLLEARLDALDQGSRTRMLDRALTCLVEQVAGYGVYSQKPEQCPVWPTLWTQVGHHPRSEKWHERPKCAAANRGLSRRRSARAPTLLRRIRSRKFLRFTLIPTISRATVRDQRQPVSNDYIECATIPICHHIR
jgi:hypothetical protein